MAKKSNAPARKIPLKSAPKAPAKAAPQKTTAKAAPQKPKAAKPAAASKLAKPAAKSAAVPVVVAPVAKIHGSPAKVGEIAQTPLMGMPRPAAKVSAPFISAAAPEPTVPASAAPAVGKVAHPAEKATRHLRAPIEIRVEITARSQSFTTTSRNIAIGGISFEAQQEFRVGDLVNVLLYIPVKKELDLLKVASEVVWVEDLKGSWMAGAAFRKFAPGDERRLRSWLIENVRAQKAGRSMP